MLKQNKFTVVLSNGETRNSKAPDVTACFACNLGILLLREKKINVSQIIDETNRVIYDKFEWAIIYRERSMEHEIGTEPLYTQSEVLSILKRYAKYVGNDSLKAETWFEKIELKI